MHAQKATFGQINYNGLMKLRLFCLLLLAALPALSEDAATPGYQVEIVVFRANSAQGGGENWSTEGSTNSTIGEESSSNSSQVGRFIGTLTPAQFQLNDLEAK